MESKKILLIIEHLGSGGAERQICCLASLLTKRGYTCRIITYIKNQFYESYLKENGVDYEYLPELENKWLRPIRFAIYCSKYKPATVISYLPSVNIMTCLARIFYSYRLIVSERNNNTSISIHDRIRFVLYSLSDVVVPNSCSQGEFIKKNFRFLAAKVTPIINCVDVDNFKPSNKKREDKFIRITTVARYARQKNFENYLKMVSLIKRKGLNVHFDWYGNKSYDRDYYSIIEADYIKFGLSDYLTLHDTCSNISKVYQNSDAFLLPSLFEGYPNVIVEAMCCGLPVLCSNVFENPYIVENGINGFLFSPDSVEEMTMAVEKLLALSAEDRHEIGCHNRSKCSIVNSPSTFIDKYVSII